MYVLDVAGTPRHITTTLIATFTTLCANLQLSTLTLQTSESHLQAFSLLLPQRLFYKPFSPSRSNTSKIAMDFTAASNQRLATYLYWPHNDPSAIDMAAAGFSSSHNARKPDSADCRECGLKLNDWHPRDNPLAEHARRKPECPFIVRNLGSALASRLKADMSVQSMASKAPPLKRAIIDERPSNPAKKKYPKSRLYQTEVAAPKPNPQAFDTWLEGAKARFFGIFDKAQKFPSSSYHDLDFVEPKDILSVRYGDKDGLHQALVRILIPVPACQLGQNTNICISPTYMESTDLYIHIGEVEIWLARLGSPAHM
jgi:hypothetical protein